MLAVSTRIVRITLLLAVLLLPLASRASDFPADGWWTLPGAALVNGERIGLLRVERYQLPEPTAVIPGLEPPQLIRERPERAWRLTIFRVETTDTPNHFQLDRDSYLATIHDGTLICFFGATESHYRYSVTPEGVTLEFVRRDDTTSPGFLHLFPARPDGKLVCAPATKDAIETLKLQILRFFP